MDQLNVAIVHVLPLSLLTKCVGSRSIKRAELELQFFSTIATLGTPYDITLQELRIECLFPADEATEESWKQVE